MLVILAVWAVAIPLGCAIAWAVRRWLLRRQVASEPTCAHGWKIQHAEKHCPQCRAKLAEEFAAAERERESPGSSLVIDGGDGTWPGPTGSLKLNVTDAPKAKCVLADDWKWDSDGAAPLLADFYRFMASSTPAGIQPSVTVEPVRPTKPIEAGDDVTVNGVVVGKVAAAYSALATMDVKLNDAAAEKLKADNQIVRRARLVTRAGAISLNVEIERVVRGWVLRVRNFGEMVGYHLVEDTGQDMHQVGMVLLNGDEFGATFCVPAARRVRWETFGGKVTEYMPDLEGFRR